MGRAPHAGPLPGVARFVQRNPRCLLAGLTLLLLLLAVALRSARRDTDLSSFLQGTSRVREELAFSAQVHNADAATSASSSTQQSASTATAASSAASPTSLHPSSSLAEGLAALAGGGHHLLLTQTLSTPPPASPTWTSTRPGGRSRPPATTSSEVLTVDALMVHLKALAIANHLTVELYEVSWSLHDLCFSPTLPDVEAPHIGIILEKLMPCAIKTPLDCFWEGSKVHGPEQPVLLSSLGPPLKWESLNPLEMIEFMHRASPHGSFPYLELVEWMRRVGISTGYLQKPCLNTTDPNCPTSAPNKHLASAPNVAAALEGGCHGLATKQMHWHEEELLGGAVHNKSGRLVQARALQSTIQLMSQQDMYDYWHKTDKVKDIKDWSSEKAKLVIDIWQRRYKEALSEFANSTSAYKLHAITSKAILEPISVREVLDLTNLQLCFGLMTLVAVALFPNIRAPIMGDARSPKEDAADSTSSLVSRLKSSLLAIVVACYVGLTFVASLGLASFFDLPLNVATTQLLPPLALAFGFHQFLLVANVYAAKFRLRTSRRKLTLQCLSEVAPNIAISSTGSLVASLAATIIPIEATTVLAYQAITFTMLVTIGSLVLMPALMITFLLYQVADSEQREFFERLQERPKIHKRSHKAKQRSNRAHTPEDEEEYIGQLMTRIQDDLERIRDESRLSTPTDRNPIAAHHNLDTPRQATKTAPIFNQHPFLNTSQFIVPNLDQQIIEPSNLMPDLLANCLQAPSAVDPATTELPVMQHSAPPSEALLEIKLGHTLESSKAIENEGANLRETVEQAKFHERYLNHIHSNRFVQAVICLIFLLICFAMLWQAPNVRCGLQLRDIVAREDEDHEALLVQEELFPIHYAFVVTRNVDYPANQRQLHEFYQSLQQIDGVVSNDSGRPQFWLALFRDWLLEIQLSFDADRGKSAISDEGWTSNATESAKLAYKLLAQTGKLENPIDKGLVETNRLVDANGIINPKAFYYYLSAWVVNDAFTYASSGANLKPEPKSWNNNPDDLKIEKARPLLYAQIPLLLNLPPNQDNLKVISEIRDISESFDKLNLPNFPTGILFIFWDQFFTLESLMFQAVAAGIVPILLIIGLLTSSFGLAAIIMIPTLWVVLELYCFTGMISMRFNGIVVALVINSVGLIVAQLVHLPMDYFHRDCQPERRVSTAFKSQSRMTATGTLLLAASATALLFSKLDFLNRFSFVLFNLAALISFVAWFLMPVVLSIFEPRTVRPEPSWLRGHKSTKEQSKSTSSRQRKKQNVSESTFQVPKKQRHKKHLKKVQSEISLSTISEEPQSNAEPQWHA